MGRSDSSKPTLDGQPRQHFGGSHVSPRDQVGSQFGIRGGGNRLHVLRTSRPCPEGRQRIIIPETARGINRPTLRTRTTEGAPIHVGSLDPHRRWWTYALGPASTLVKVVPRRTPRRSIPPPVEATIENPNASASQPTNRSRDVMRLPPESDVVSSDSTNSVREQLRQVNQRLDEVQKDFVKSKEEVGETTKDGSPFAPEILDKTYPLRFPTTDPGALRREH
ncbi:hypothetical protein BHE74_00030242 [Ensete ventricosum]|nr:hypothetical protein BHE74_00030242 [Ensete ventricosum]